jgi:hypothetical protein
MILQRGDNPLLRAVVELLVCDVGDNPVAGTIPGESHWLLRKNHSKQCQNDHRSTHR